MQFEKVHFTKEKETLLLTVYGKALHSRSNNPVLQDQWAEQAVDHIDYDFGKLKVRDYESLLIASRARQFDLFTEQYLSQHPRAIVLHLGAGLALATAQVYGRLKGTKINGWFTMYGCGEPGNGMFLRAAQALLFPGPICVPTEAMYWWANADGAGQMLSGAQDYVMHFPAGQLPPDDGFWSLTMGDAKNHYVPNPLNRYHVGDRSGLVPNADGSVDIYIQNTSPAGHESNWLPASSGNFILWFRVYIPGAAILNREYKMPQIVKIK